jgi:predicted nucleic acid-binding protein
MLRYMLDTNICIYVIKNRPAQLRQRFNELADQLCISVITLAECPRGAAQGGSPRGERLVSDAPMGLWETVTFTAGLRQTDCRGTDRPVG